MSTIAEHRIARLTIATGARSSCWATRATMRQMATTPTTARDGFATSTAAVATAARTGARAATTDRCAITGVGSPSRGEQLRQTASWFGCTDGPDAAVLSTTDAATRARGSALRRARAA